MMEKYYNLLNSEPDDTDEELQQKFKKIAIENHPDNGGSKEKFFEYVDAFDKIKEHRRIVKRVMWNQRDSHEFLGSFFGSRTGPYSGKR